MAAMKIDQPGSSADLRELIVALRTAEADVAHDFYQCTKLEKRGMVAMRLHSLYGWIACRYPAPSREALAYSMFGHTWWITGLVLQRDRKAEVKIAINAAAWREVLECNDGPAELLAFAVQAGALKDESAAESFSAEVWRRLGLDAKARHTG